MAGHGGILGERYLNASQAWGGGQIGERRLPTEGSTKWRLAVKDHQAPVWQLLHELLHIVGHVLDGRLEVIGADRLAVVFQGLAEHLAHHLADRQAAG